MLKAVSERYTVNTDNVTTGQMFTQTGQEIAREAWDDGDKREFHIEGMRLGYISTLQRRDDDYDIYKLVFHWVKM